MRTFKVFDTCSLLLQQNLFIDETVHVVIPSIVLQELEHIKHSEDNPEAQYQARQMIKLLDENSDKWELFIYKDEYSHFLVYPGVPLTNDTKILACAIAYDKECHPDETVFVTNDLYLKTLANKLYFGEDSIESVREVIDTYTGYKEIKMSDEEMADFYSDLTFNKYDSYINEYLIVKDKNGQIVDQLCWDGINYRALEYANFCSRQLGDYRPMKDDVYQALVADSLKRNKITLIRGKAGSGKSTLTLSYLFSALERHAIDKIIVFCNPVAVKNSAKLGFYPGSKNDKLMDSQIGNFLGAKLGSPMALESLINNEKVVLIPIADCRGFDTTGMRAGVYIPEAQNLDVALMKLILQRIGEDSICIIDGDNDQQVDLQAYEGKNNGMRRLSKIFRGRDIYGEVALQKIHRSRIAAIADEM